MSRKHTEWLMVNGFEAAGMLSDRLDMIQGTLSRTRRDLTALARLEARFPDKIDSTIYEDLEREAWVELRWFVEQR